MSARYLKIGNRILMVVAFPEGIYVQEVYPKIGINLAYPYETWMQKLSKPSLYAFGN